MVTHTIKISVYKNHVTTFPTMCTIDTNSYIEQSSVMVSVVTI